MAARAGRRARAHPRDRAQRRAAGADRRPRKPIQAIRRIIESGQETGEFRADLDPALAATVFYGGIDEVLTGWVLGQLPDGDEEIAAAEHTVIDVVCAGFAASLASAE